MLQPPALATAVTGTPAIQPRLIQPSPRPATSFFPAAVHAPAGSTALPQFTTPRPQAAPAALGPPGLLQKIAGILQDKQGTLKPAAALCWQQTAQGRKGLDVGGLARFHALISQALGVPEQVFGQIADEFLRFDFDGDGELEEHECYRLVKHHLLDFRKKLGCPDDVVMIPFKTPLQGGYRIQRELGHGSQGVLKLAVNAANKQRCVKVCSKARVDALSLERIKEEYDIMHHLHNRCIARTFEIFQDDQSYYIVNEPYFGHDFVTLTSNARASAVEMTEEWWRSLFRQCFVGIQYLHKHALMHCDIKESNLMLKTPDYHQPSVVIIDFGLAEQFVHYGESFVGTPGYVPPETWLTRKWYPKGDVFSMGVVILQLMIDWVPISPSMQLGSARFGVFTAGVKDHDGIRQATLERPVPVHFLPQPYPLMNRLVQRLMEKDPAGRPTSVQVLQDPWFTTQTVRGPAVDPAELRQQRLAKPTPA